MRHIITVTTPSRRRSRRLDLLLRLARLLVPTIPTTSLATPHRRVVLLLPCHVDVDVQAVRAPGLLDEVQLLGDPLGVDVAPHRPHELDLAARGGLLAHQL